MSRRTFETDGYRVEVVDDLDALVSDKREHWRAAPAKARRRQRRYGKRLTKTILYANVDRDDTQQRPPPSLHPQSPHRRVH